MLKQKRSAETEKKKSAKAKKKGADQKRKSRRKRRWPEEKSRRKRRWSWKKKRAGTEKGAALKLNREGWADNFLAFIFFPIFSEKIIVNSFMLDLIFSMN